MMLNLTLLDEKTENKIIELYKKYRDTAINKCPDDSPLTEINNILKNKYLGIAGQARNDALE